MSLTSATFTQLLEADEALRAYRRSYDALAAGWTQWGQRRAALAEQLATERPRAAAQAANATAAAPTPTAAQPVATEPVKPVASESTEEGTTDVGSTAVEPDVIDTAGDHTPAADVQPQAAQPASPIESVQAGSAGGFSAPGAPTSSPASAPEPARASAISTPVAQPGTTPQGTRQPSPPTPARPPRRRMAEVFTAPVLLGVAGASLMIAAAIVAVAITWATAAPGVRGLLVLVVAGAVGALGAWLRRLHLVITSGAVGIVAMGFAGTSAPAFLSESAALVQYSATLGFVFAGAAGLVLARLRLAWVGPGAAVALSGFVIALTVTTTTHTAPGQGIWAWSLTGVVTAFGLAATYALWPWKSAQHIVVWAGLGWVGVTGAFAALWLWFGDVAVSSAFAAGIPIVALAWLSRRWQPLPVVLAVVLTTVVTPGIAFVAGVTFWQLTAVLAATLVAIVAVVARAGTAIRKPALASLRPGFVLAWLAVVGYGVSGWISRFVGSFGRGSFSSDATEWLDPWAAITALFLAVAVAGLKFWRLDQLGMSAERQRVISALGITAAATAVVIGTIAATALAAAGWSEWVWAVTGVVLAVALAATHRIWWAVRSQHVLGWLAVTWVSLVGILVAAWIWSGDLTVVRALAGVVPVAGLVVLTRWLPRVAGAVAVALMTLVVPGVSSVMGLVLWQQTTVAAGTIAVGITAAIFLPPVLRRAIALGLAPAVVVVAMNVIPYAVTTLSSRGMHAMRESVSLRVHHGDVFADVNPWAGVAAVVAGLAIAGVRMWRLRDLSHRLARWARAGAVVGALMVVAGVTIFATAAVETLVDLGANSGYALLLAAAGAAAIGARVLWPDPAVRNVSSVGGVILAAAAGLHAVWAMVVGELPVLASLGVALVPLSVLAVWGARRPVQGTAVASLLATATAAGLVGTLSGSVAAALAVGIGFAAVVAWTMRLLPVPQRTWVSIGTWPALAWGGIAGLLSAADALQWLDISNWAPRGWVGVAALATAVALAATRLGPWPTMAAIAERVGAGLTLVATPVTLGAGLFLTTLNAPAQALVPAIGSAVVAAAGLAWWRDGWARRMTRVGAVLWVAAAGVMGWLNVAYSSWDLATTLALSVLALVLLVAASRWWPRAALVPTALLLSGAPLALAVRGEWGVTAASVLMLAGAALVMLLLLLVPKRLRYIGVIGVIPALSVGVVASVIVTATAAAQAVTGGRAAIELEHHWWALGLVGMFGVAVAVLGRLNVHRSIDTAVRFTLATTLVAVVIVASAAFAQLVAPHAPGAAGRLLLAPGIAVVLGAGILVGAVRWERRLSGGPSGASVPERAITAAIVRWGALGWVVVLAVALQLWIYLADVPWQVGTAVAIALVAALGFAGRWWPYAGLLPAVALITWLPFAVVPVALTVPFAAAACVAMVLVAAGTWTARWLTRKRRRAVLVGLVPAAAGAMVSVLTALLLTLGALGEHLVDSASSTQAGSTVAPTWWQIGVLAAAVAAALAWSSSARYRGWLLLTVAVVAAAALPPLWAVVLLSAVALSLLFAGKWLRTGSIAAGIAVAIAMVWSVGSDTALGVTAATATAIAGAAALGWRTRALAWGAVVAPVTALIAGVFIARAVDAATVAVPAGVGLSMVTVLALVSARRDKLRGTVAPVAIAVTVVAPLFADTAAMMGVAYVLGAATWWRLLTAGLTWAKWMCATTASAGAAALLVSINIQLIEAYTAVPAAALLLIGLQWMRDRPELRSLTALAPGLAAALVPSYLALVLEPDALWRTFALIGAIVVLALIGLRLRWFAPILGTAVTAVVLSVLQMIVGGNLVVRLIAFAVVGALLLAIASYFERLKELR